MESSACFRFFPVRQQYSFAYITAAVVLSFVFSNCDAVCSRKLMTRTLCPSEVLQHCKTSSGQTINLVHTTAEGNDDTIHFVYSTWGVPSVLIAKTSHNITLDVDYKKLLNDSIENTNGSITFGDDKNVKNLFVVMISEIIDFFDENNTAKLEPNSPQVVHRLSDFTWKNVNISGTNEVHSIVFETASDSKNPLFEKNGSVAVTFRVLCDEGYFTELPNLHYNSNMSLADIVLNNLTLGSNKSRVAVALSVAMRDEKNENMTIDEHKSIDDEHSPGSFVTLNWLTTPSHVESGAFLQWKPSCYREPVRNLQSLSLSKYTEPRRYSYDEHNVSRGLAYDYFGDSLKTDVNVFYSFIYFGLPEDGFYIKTQYDAWSFSFGFGMPPSDKISMGIIFVIAVGLGIPVVLIIGGAIYVCIRKYKHREGYEEITGSYSEIN